METTTTIDSPGSERDGRAALTAPPTGVVAEALERFTRLASAADRCPRLLIDGHGHVLWQSSDTERLLRPPMPLWIESGRVHTANGSGNGSWSDWLDTIAGDGGRLLLTGQAAGTWVLVRGWASRFGEHRLIFVKCAMAWPFRDVTSCGLAEDFGLTRSECAVLDEFARLAKPEEIARRLGISIGTARSHLKQIHTKMSVSSGVQLLRITRAYTDT